MKPLVVRKRVIAPGTRFADIPTDWRCPLCDVGKKISHSSSSNGQSPLCRPTVPRSCTTTLERSLSGWLGMRDVGQLKRGIGVLKSGCRILARQFGNLDSSYARPPCLHRQLAHPVRDLSARINTESVGRVLLIAVRMLCILRPPSVCDPCRITESALQDAPTDDCKQGGRAYEPVEVTNCRAKILQPLLSTRCHFQLSNVAHTKPAAQGLSSVVVARSWNSRDGTMTLPLELDECEIFLADITQRTAPVVGISAKRVPVRYLFRTTSGFIVYPAANHAHPLPELASR